MELVYAAVIGTGIGLLLRYLLPGRSTYGVLLLPAVGGVAVLVVWVAMTWLGLQADWYWALWVASLAAAALVSAIVALAVSRRRESADAHALHVLASGRA